MLNTTATQTKDLQQLHSYPKEGYDCGLKLELLFHLSSRLLSSGLVKRVDMPSIVQSWALGDLLTVVDEKKS